MRLRPIATAACTASLALFLISAVPSCAAQSGGVNAPAATKPLPSPPATAGVSLNGKAITIKYNAPSLRGRHLGGPEIVPYGKVWRTGANPATTLITAANLKIGTLNVPAGTYTLYTLPSTGQWLLIVNKQTGQWGTVYNMDRDLGRTPMMSRTLPTPQETMSISFENTSGASTELHIKWDTTDEYVTVTAQE